MDRTRVRPALSNTLARGNDRVTGPRGRDAGPAHGQTRDRCIGVSCGVRAHAQLPAVDLKSTPINQSGKLTSASISETTSTSGGCMRGVRALDDSGRARDCADCRSIVCGLMDGALVWDRDILGQMPSAEGCGPASCQGRFCCRHRGLRRCACWGQSTSESLQPARLGPTRLALRGHTAASASLAQLVEHALRKRMVVGSIPTGGLSCPLHSPMQSAAAPGDRSLHRTPLPLPCRPERSATALARTFPTLDRIDTCEIRAHTGRPHRLSRPTP